MLTAKGSGASIARRFGRAVLVGAGLFGALLATVAAQDAAPITPAQLTIVEDLTNGALGHDETFAAQPVQLLGMHGNIARQVSGNDDNSGPGIHFFNLFSSDPGVIVLLYEKRGAFLRGYRLDEHLHFVRGYSSTGGNGQLSDAAISNDDGVSGVEAELKWWSAGAAQIVQEAQKALASGQSPDDVAKSYGVSAQTLNKWLAAAKQP
jgi:hypothetical protein